MGKTLTITAVTGTSPYDVYLCEQDGSNCFYILTTSTIPNSFEIPLPYDQMSSYMLKLIDAQGCIITNIG